MKTLVTETLDLHINIIWHEYSVKCQFCLFLASLMSIFWFCHCLVSFLAVKLPVSTSSVWLMLLHGAWIQNMCLCHFSLLFSGRMSDKLAKMGMSTFLWWQLFGMIPSSKNSTCWSWRYILRALTWAFFIHVRLKIYA